MRKMSEKIKLILFYLIIALSAFILDFGMRDWVNKISVRLEGETELTIRMADTDRNNGKIIQILYGGMGEELFGELKEASSDSTDWTFTEGQKGVSWTMLETDTRGAEINVRVKPSLNRYVIFHMDSYDGTVEIICDGRIQQIDTYHYGGAATKRVYPFRDMPSVSGFRIILYTVLFVVFFIVLCRCLKGALYADIKEVIQVQSIIYLLLIALLFAGTLKDSVNRMIVHHLLPQREVIVSTEHKTDISIQTNDIRIPVAESDYLKEVTSSNTGYQSILYMTKVPEEYIQLAVSENISSITYETGGKSYIYEITEHDREVGFCRIYPFASSVMKVCLSILIYCIFTVIIICLLILIHIVMSSVEKQSQTIRKSYSGPVLWFLVIFLIVYATGMYQYINKIDLPYYMPDNLIGDQYGYWHTYIFKDGFINLDINIASFRGYTNYLLPSVSHVIGARLNIDPVMVYLIFPALMFAWLIAVIVPEMYEIITKKKPGLISVALFFLIFTYYNKSYVTLVNTDFYNNVLFFATIAYFVKAYRKNSIVYSVIAGLSLSWMINMHYNFLIYIVIVATGYPLCILLNRILNQRGITICSVWEDQWQKLKSGFSAKRVVCMIVAAVCFFMVCMPQTIINYKSGHTGLFPHDSEYAYAGHPVSWSMWNTFLTYGMILWPKFIGDDQLGTMKTQLYDSGETLYPAQAMDVYANSPIETAVMVTKKMFTMFDYKSNVQYGTEDTWRETKGLIFSFFNYLILLTGLYILIRKKDLPFSAKVFSWIIFFATVVTAMTGHVEQRGSMTFYIILCMFFTYIFCGEMVKDQDGYKELCDPGLYRFIAFGELLCFGISMTMWA